MTINSYGLIFCIAAFMFVMWSVKNSQDDISTQDKALHLYALIISSFGIVFFSLWWIV